MNQSLFHGMSGVKRCRGSNRGHEMEPILGGSTNAYSNFQGFPL